MSNLLLDAGFVSNAHALIRWTGRSWEIRDLGSTNGTTVNGIRAVPGEPVRLSRGSRITFGGPAETWELVADEPPAPMAIPLDGGRPSVFASGVLPIPNDADPLAIIYHEGSQWFLEEGQEQSLLEPGQRFAVAGRQWLFECPALAAATAGSDAWRYDLESTTLVFGVSRDEEHVALSLRKGAATRNLGERSCFYLAMVLARQRLEDKLHGVSETGWLDVDSLLKMVPEYSCYSHLNVEIHRLRKVVFDAGLQDAVRLIERRRGQVRIGTDRVELRPASD